MCLLLNIFLPELALAFEYQGEQHYSLIPVYGSLQDQQMRDQFKIKSSRDSGITLIHIPCWWDNKLPSLVGTIRQFRPDIIFEDNVIHGNPIPSAPSLAKKQELSKVRTGKRFVQCSNQQGNLYSPVLPNRVSGYLVAKDWLLFEARAGITVFYDGQGHLSDALYKTPIQVPQDILSNLPPIAFEATLTYKHI
jgi:hypothetical protein